MAARSGIEDLLEQYDSSADELLIPYLAMATATQLDRSGRETARSDAVSRSTALWTLLGFDPVLALVVEPELRRNELGAEIGVRQQVEPTEPGLLSRTMTEAVSQFLERHGGTTLGPREASLAILEHHQENSAVGALERRFTNLGVDAVKLEIAIRSLTSGETPDDLSEATDLEQRAVDRARKIALSEPPLVEALARVLTQHGEHLLALGDTKRAEQVVGEAVEAARSADSQRLVPSATLVRALALQGAFLTRTQRRDEALLILEEAVDASEREGGGK